MTFHALLLHISEKVSWTSPVCVARRSGCIEDPLLEGGPRGREMNTLVEVLEGADTRERLLKGKVLVGTSRGHLLAAFHRDLPSAPQKDGTLRPPGHTKLSS